MLSSDRSRMLLLLLLPHNSQSLDGCKGGDDNYWKCGDVCTYRRSDCSCGNETLWADEPRWRCGSQCTSGLCLDSAFKNGDDPEECWNWSPAVCATGVVRNLTQGCNNTCNEHLVVRDRYSLNLRSHISACTEPNTCVKEGELLRPESEKPRQRVSNADRKVFANPESFCNKLMIC